MHGVKNVTIRHFHPFWTGDIQTYCSFLKAQSYLETHMVDCYTCNMCFCVIMHDIIVLDRNVHYVCNLIIYVTCSFCASSMIHVNIFISLVSVWIQVRWYKSGLGVQKVIILMLEHFYIYKMFFLDDCKWLWVQIDCYMCNGVMYVPTYKLGLLCQKLWHHTCHIMLSNCVMFIFMCPKVSGVWWPLIIMYGYICNFHPYVELLHTEHYATHIHML